MALIAVLVAFLAIISGSGGSGGDSSPSDSATTPAATTTQAKKKASTQATKRAAKESPGKTYTVQVGDTLGGIADKTGVALSRIEELNPNVDPHAMTTGQEIRLK
ncbi:MAG TPA: LysM domain-containing protein [Thermoleophilaceae bacterium]|nr:LysM domain-containing protein [Thermoleophilaceae bacterium]